MGYRQDNAIIVINVFPQQVDPPRSLDFHLGGCPYTSMNGK